MDILAQEQIKAALYKVFQIKYFKNTKSGKKNFAQLHEREKREFFSEQSKFIEEEFYRVKATLETIAKNCGQDIANKIHRILITSTDKIKSIEEDIRHKDIYIGLCRKYNLDYIADKLENM